MNNVLILKPPISFSFPLRIKQKYSLKNFLTLNIILIVLLIGFCIFQVNSLITKGYLVQNYEKQLNDLTVENEGLEIKFGKINSLENIDTLVKNLNFEKVDKIYYIRILEGQVAKEYNLPSTRESQERE
jgi:hypothetical protein